MKVLVEVRASEEIVPHGVTKATWWVHDGETWQSVRDYPGATFTREDARPSVVWETRAELEVPIGTWLMRVRVWPRQQQFSDPMRYLRGEALRALTHRRVSYFVAGPRGVLKPADPKNAPADAELPTSDDTERTAL